MRWRTAAVILALLALTGALLARPLAPRGLGSHPHPAASYDEALKLVGSLRAEDSPAIAPECETLLLSHGTRTPRVVVLLHGLTNCPAQCESLARLVYANGDNVLVPRLPHHGFADRMTDELSRVEARELCALTDRAIDAARGLGDTIIVAGLSIGGVMAAWAAQQRADVDRAVVIAPMIAWASAPRATPALVRAASFLPNAFVWWDDKLKQNVGGPKHVYPRFSTRSVAATMLLGAAVCAEADRRLPACRSIAMITVGGDIAAANSAAAMLVERWRKRGATNTVAYEFPAALHLNHDVVDPEQVGGNPAITYPVLMSVIAP